MSIETREYIDSIQGERHALLLKLKGIIEATCPEVEPEMWYHLVAYRKSNGWRKWVAIGYRKEGATLYTNGSHMDGFRLKHPEFKYGKGSVRFKPGDLIPADDLKNLIKNAIEDSEETS